MSSVLYFHNSNFFSCLGKPQLHYQFILRMKDSFSLLKTLTILQTLTKLNTWHTEFAIKLHFKKFPFAGKNVKEKLYHTGYLHGTIALNDCILHLRT